MNVSLNVNSTPGGYERLDPRTIQECIDEHQGVMRGAGYDVTGAVMLIPEQATEYHGSYQVWNQITQAGGPDLWVFINTEGEPIFAEIPPFEPEDRS